jgi:hypothetical protein
MPLRSARPCAVEGQLILVLQNDKDVGSSVRRLMRAFHLCAQPPPMQEPSRATLSQKPDALLGLVNPILYETSRRHVFARIANCMGLLQLRDNVSIVIQ